MNIEVICISRICIASKPHFDSTFDGFQWHILFQCGTLIDALETTILTISFEGDFHAIDYIIDVVFDQSSGFPGGAKYIFDEISMYLSLAVASLETAFPYDLWLDQ
ncbi:hypothetical protein JTB14_013174 [Gonioctena quinquepunctata]|nr:hypothetical protein JTB14_013174 [Gonioctena quinquepunctata]